MDSARPADQAPPDPTTPRSAWVWIALVVALSLAIRIALLPHRWVNPDEGAHLMDGKLVLDGLVPIADFDARQVLYVYLLAGWERLFGPELLAARVLPMLLGVGVIPLVFLLGRQLVGTRAALIAAATYAFLPTAVIWSVNVHLEVVTLVFTALGYLALVHALRTERSPRQLALVGVVFGITYYIRESALAHVMATGVVLAIVGRREPRRLARELLALALGFGVVVLVVVAFFARYFTFRDLWFSSLDPLFLPLKAVGLVPAEGGAAEIGTAREVRQSWDATLRNLRDVVAFGSFLLVAGAAAFGARIAGRRQMGDDIALLVLGAWLGSLGLAYSYWMYSFGFYPQYFTEFLPPLVILFGAVAGAAADRWLISRRAGLALAVFLLGMAAAFIAGGHVAMPGLAYIVVAALLLALAGLRRDQWRRWWAAAGVTAASAGAAFVAGWFLPSGAEHGVRLVALLLGLAAALSAALPLRPARADRWAFGLLLVLACASFLAWDYSGHRISASYYCVWPPSVLRDVASRVRAASGPRDQVLSGGVIWALEADRHPFLNISHPLGYLDGLTSEERAMISRGLAQRAPRLILLDGYTERTVLPDSVARRRFLEQEYRAAGEVTGGRYPVKLYVRRADAAPVGPAGAARSR